MVCVGQLRFCSPFVIDVQMYNFCQDLASYVGQETAVGEESQLRRLLLSSSNLPSLILWGPPGCGKTSLANVISHKVKLW